MNFECGICQELLHRVSDTSITSFLQIAARHSRLPDIHLTLLQLEYYDLPVNGKINLKKARRNLRQALESPNHPQWLFPLMFQFMKIVCTPCGHLTHYWCHQEWVQTRKRFGILSCPYCRQYYRNQGDLRTIKLGPLARESESKIQSKEIIRDNDKFRYGNLMKRLDTIDEMSGQRKPRVGSIIWTSPFAPSANHSEDSETNRGYLQKIKNNKICDHGFDIPLILFTTTVCIIKYYVKFVKDQEDYEDDSFELEDEDLLDDFGCVDGIFALLAFLFCSLCWILDYFMEKDQE